ncbi:MAG: biopolymer transporter ExbD [Bacteroidales bacterium]|uniref:biopolymer transporter ExbD n=1 Tax=Porphyromonas sp. TaxID=1924944 RepID=UPI002978AA2F|nr:biopolymer transporter ExbD [Porphyromonas sp.]MDD7438216.1 biopolymer transporter ExbD [Bacteroidales bacterium]MDY3067053.1 biopolymer transporter ExbD [Porphyromonas sp.]
MARGKKKVPQINGSSTADISFILLLFFLLTTSMGTDSGLARQLPPAVPPDQQDVSVDINRRNMLRVNVNNLGQILANGEVVNLDGLREKVIEFVLNENDRADLAERVVETFPLVGAQKVTKNHVISLTNTVDTRYSDYILVQNELTKAYMQIRDQQSRKLFGVSLEDANTQQQEVLIKMYPQKISEANPREFGSKK